MIFVPFVANPLRNVALCMFRMDTLLLITCMFITAFHQSTRNGCPIDSVEKKKHSTSQVPLILEIHLGDAQWIPGLKLLTGILGNPPGGSHPKALSHSPQWQVSTTPKGFSNIFHWEKPQAPKKPFTNVTGSGRFHQTSQGFLLICTKPRAQSKYRPLSFNRTPAETM